MENATTLSFLAGSGATTSDTFTRMVFMKAKDEGSALKVYQRQSEYTDQVKDFPGVTFCKILLSQADNKLVAITSFESAEAHANFESNDLIKAARKNPEYLEALAEPPQVTNYRGSLQ